MSLELRWESNGTVVKTWYGRYTTCAGKRKLTALVPLRGKPFTKSASGGGDADFLASRKEAENALARLIEESRRGRIDKKTALAIYSERTGTKMVSTDLAKLPELSDKYESGRRITDEWKSWKRKVIVDFSAWAIANKYKVALDIDRKCAQAYLKKLYTMDDDGKVMTASTIRRCKAVLAEIFDHALPEGAPNPWRSRDVRVEVADGDTEYNRVPLSPAEVVEVLKAAESDGLAHDLIACALSTGLRRGDVCRLKWSCVDLKEKRLTLTTGKTGAELCLPILQLLHGVLLQRKKVSKKGDVFVFPEAEELLRDHPDQITWRVKKVFAMAFSPDTVLAPQADEKDLERLSDIFEAVYGSVCRAAMSEVKRTRFLDVISRYSQGQSYRVIKEETGIHKATISEYLHEAEKLSGHHFLKDARRTGGFKDAIRNITRVSRTMGNRKASKYDFHALRTTFVTLALSAGIGVEILKALTGHATVEIVMRHYFKPKGSDFEKQLCAAMPASLTLKKKSIALGETKSIGENVSAVLHLVNSLKLNDEERQQVRELI
jgi:integrase